MKKIFHPLQIITPIKSWGFMYLFITAIILTSCGSSKNLHKVDYRSLAKASIKLDMDIQMNDDHKLMIESSKWIGIPYRYGGTTEKGVDCSGLTLNIYKRVYKINLARNSQAQFDDNVEKEINKSNLQQGDLVFFSSTQSKKNINHVGIYLKDGKFIHSSSSNGVRLDYINNKYWKKRWVSGGRVIDK